MQGDVASIIEELVKKLQINTAAATNSQQLIESYIKDVIDSYNEAIEQKNWPETKEQISETAKAIEKLSMFLDAL